MDDPLYAFVPVQEGWWQAIMVGIVEETGKVAAVVRLIRNPRFHWTLNGLLFGAAVGTGFAAFESFGYAFMTLMQSGDWLMVVAERALLAPAGHIVWTGLAAAALWKVKGRRQFQWEMLQDSLFLRVFGLVVMFHFLWDSPLVLPFLNPWGKYFVLGGISWIIVLSYIHDGLKQIKEAQARDKQPASSPPAGISVAV